MALSDRKIRNEHNARALLLYFYIFLETTIRKFSSNLLVDERKLWLSDSYFTFGKFRSSSTLLSILLFWRHEREIFIMSWFDSFFTSNSITFFSFQPISTIYMCLRIFMFKKDCALILLKIKMLYFCANWYQILLHTFHLNIY
jgi:hypothetical protein